MLVALGPDHDDGRFVVRAAATWSDDPGLFGQRLDAQHPVVRNVVDGRAVLLTNFPEGLLAAADGGAPATAR
jgi:hypothetical protein